MVKINKIQEPIVPLYFNDELVGYIDNQLSLYDVRVQIKQQGLSGYYVIYNNQKLIIDSNGRISDWPEGFFDQFDNLLMELL